MTYRLSEEGNEGLKDLEFWLRTLASKLPPWDQCTSLTKPTVSVIVIGTFLDLLLVNKRKRPLREAAVREIAFQC